jgi:hypothetical protein
LSDTSPSSDDPSPSSDMLCDTDIFNFKRKGKEPILETPSESDVDTENMENDFSPEGDRVKGLASKKAKRREYDLTRRYHIEWSAKHAWAVPLMDDDHHYVKCEICTTMDGRPCILMPKIDTLKKHEGQRKVRIFTLFLFLLYFEIFYSVDA